MKYKKVIFLSIVFLVISLFQLSNESQAVNYDTEIGLTFNGDVDAVTSSGSSTTSESSTYSTSESSTYSTLESSSVISQDKSQLPETGIIKTVKSGITGLLPSTGSKNNYLYIFLGFIILIVIFATFRFKAFRTFKKMLLNRR